MKDLINREKLLSLSLLTALIMALVFANSNVTSVAADPSPDPGTMTFNSNVTMEFETGNNTWFSPGKYMGCYNVTDPRGANITEIKNGTEFQVDARPGWDLVTPEAGQWWQIYSAQLYGLYIAFKIDDVYGPAGNPEFNVSQVYGYWPGAPKNFTIDPPVTYFEAELMQPTIETGVTYMAFTDYAIYKALPTNNTWWNVTEYPGPAVNIAFHINYTEFYWPDPVTGDDYYRVQFDELRNATGQSVDKIDLLYTPILPVEGVEAIQMITEVKQTEYYISSPACLLPEDSWWNITYPSEVAGTRFHVDTSEEKPTAMGFLNYMHIDNVTGSTSITPPGVGHVEAIWEGAPNVATIGSGSWHKFISGAMPNPLTCWNITATAPSDPTLIGATFCIDIAGGGVFSIDEVLNQTGQPWNFTGLSLANVTAEELIPFIHVDPAITNTTALGPGNETTISIKTNYTFHVWSYEFTLEWNPAVLNCTGVTNGDLFAAATFQNGTVDNVNGKLSLTGAKFDYGEGERAPQVYPTSDNCTLANATFKVVGTGDSDITLGPETRLVKVTKDGEGVKQNVIDDVTGKTKDGYFCNYDGPIVHDIAVTNITCYYLDVDVDETYQTWTAHVNVTVLNNGTLTETFDVKVYYDNMAPDWLIGAETDIRIAGGTNTTAEFSWDLASACYGYRGVLAKAIIASGIPDGNPADNVFTGSMLVKLTGDIDADSDVDWFDFGSFCAGYPTFPPEPVLVLGADLEGDGDVDGDDFILFAGYYGKEQPYY